MQPERTYFEVEGDSPRARLVGALRVDLLGPEREDEVLNQSPNTRYLVGMLAPRGTEIDPTEDEGFDAAASEDDEAEAGPRLSATLDASSIGISFVVQPALSGVSVHAAWGEYAREQAEDEPNDVDDEDAEESDRTPEAAGATPSTGRRRRRPRYRWPRTQQRHEFPLALEEGTGRQEVAAGVRLEWDIRRLQVGTYVTVFLVNGREAPTDRRPPDEDWLYQPELRVAADGAPFLSRSVERTEPDPDPDVASADLVYRNRPEFASGHAVAAAWRRSESEPDRAEELWTEVIPEHEVPSIVPSLRDVEPVALDALAAAPSASAIEELVAPTLDAYQTWIETHRGELAALAPRYAPVAADHLALAERALERMHDGVKALHEDAATLDAFQFANLAVADGLRHSTAVRAARRGEETPTFEPKWRPFQLGFLLLCIRGIVETTHDDRTLVDLLWFPTGGGKTEAYLGLTAFVLAHRRLRRFDDALDAESGTAVLMRYTLRLVTIQQFQRALTVICAAEVLRRRDVERWGTKRFTIGLWVGMRATPNSYVDSRDALDDLRQGKAVYTGSPYQVLWCPWCGNDLEPGDYRTDDALERTLIVCRNPDCEFSGAQSEEGLGLPVLVVDQEIYRHPPSLLLATVDKFAQMPWNGRIQALFGRVDRYCPRHGFLTAADDHSEQRHRELPGYEAAEVQTVERRPAPPELIIQDELHLISGPLGTLVGLYETAVDGLAARDFDGAQIRAKVIASTATIRRAQRQVEGLFARDVAVFPPLGLDASDSFFARQAGAEEAPGRLYVGVYAPGKSVKTALVRAYAALLSRARIEFQAAEDEQARKLADAYMTLVGYFNSLRELGGALRLVEDDVPARLRVLRRRGFGPERRLFEHGELTSRVPSSRIPQILSQLERTHLQRETGRFPLDILLASNMISVGVDIDRLGLMVVSGQPKTAAEYIQATSRIGRTHPGLVIEVFNWVRPRDTSHYERFRHFHDTFYRHVEATSVTPFSARARDRALRAVFVGYARLGVDGLSAPRAADNFEADSEPVQSLLADIARRAETVTDEEDVRRETEALLHDAAQRWDAWADDQRGLVYTRRSVRPNQQPQPRVLLRSMEGDGGTGAWEAAGSLREVETELDVVAYGEGELYS